LIVTKADKNGKLLPSLPFLFNAAKKLGSKQVELAILDSPENPTFNKEISAFAPLSKIHCFPKNDELTIEEASENIKNIMSPQITHVLAAHNSVCKDLIPRLAGKLDIQPITDIIHIEVFFYKKA